MKRLIIYCAFLLATSLMYLQGAAAVAATPSVNGANIPAGPSIIDEQGNTWTLASEHVYKNGANVGNSSAVVFLLEYDGMFYALNSSNAWYVWTGSLWSRTNDPRAISANDASIGLGTEVLVDSARHVWALGTNGYVYKDGYRAGGGYDIVVVLNHDGVIYVENTNALWYSWNGSGWIPVSGDPRGPNLVQYNSYTSSPCPANDPGCIPPFYGNSSVTFNKTTTKGNAIWIAATVSDYGGTHTITVTDSQNNTYYELNQANDTQPGAQSLAQFYAENIRGGSDTITVNWTSDNYKGVVAAEIGGIAASPLVGHSVQIQDGKLVSASDNVSSNTISVPSGKTPALIIALTMDTDGGNSDTGGSGYCAVPVGTDYALITQLWNWSPGGRPVCNLATLETRTITSSSGVAGAFTTSHLSDPYVTVSAAFH